MEELMRWPENVILSRNEETIKISFEQNYSSVEEAQEMYKKAQTFLITIMTPKD